MEKTRVALALALLLAFQGISDLASCSVGKFSFLTVQRHGERKICKENFSTKGKFKRTMIWSGKL